MFRNRLELRNVLRRCLFLNPECIFFCKCLDERKKAWRMQESLPKRKVSVLFLVWKFQLEAWLLMAEKGKSKKQRRILWRKAFFSFKIYYNKKRECEKSGFYISYYSYFNSCFFCCSCFCFFNSSSVGTK